MRKAAKKIAVARAGAAASGWQTASLFAVFAGFGLAAEASAHAAQPAHSMSGARLAQAAPAKKKPKAAPAPQAPAGYPAYGGYPPPAYQQPYPPRPAPAAAPQTGYPPASQTGYPAAATGAAPAPGYGQPPANYGQPPAGYGQQPPPPPPPGYGAPQGYQPGYAPPPPPRPAQYAPAPGYAPPQGYGQPPAQQPYAPAPPRPQPAAYAPGGYPQQPPPPAQGYTPGSQGYPQPGYQPAPYGYGQNPDAGGLAGVADTARRHTGFYLRAMVGGGYAKVGDADDGTAYLGGSVGYFLMENLALHGDLSLGGFTGIGAGATYFLTPVDVYLGASLMAIAAGVQVTDRYGNAISTGSSEAGPGIGLIAGKQWWMGDSFGLGAAATIHAGQVEFGGKDNTCVSANISLVASFN